jgi:hypothetical protein
VLTFLDSIMAVGSNVGRSSRATGKKSILMSNLREKVTSDLLKFSRINGALLNKLIDMRLQEDLSNRKRFQISSANSFYKLL